MSKNKNYIPQKNKFSFKNVTYDPNFKGPVLSIGLIVKNEENHIGNCLSALMPLKEKINCEIIIGDTGSTDKTKEIAKKYTDNIFDIVWEDDFAAARNKVMERAKGEWYFSVDADEYLDDNIDEIVKFFNSNEHKKYLSANITIYNYVNEMNLGKDYILMSSLRIIRLSTGIRFESKIHESLTLVEPNKEFKNTSLHHYGYFYKSKEQSDKKAKRNDDLLVKELEKDPNNLRVLCHAMDTVLDSERKREYSDRIIEIVKKDKTNIFSEPSLKKAINFYFINASPKKAAELCELALEYFPNHIATRLDVNYILVMHNINDKKYDDVFVILERYHKAFQDFNFGRYNKRELSYSFPLFATENKFNIVVIMACNLFLDKCSDKDLTDEEIKSYLCKLEKMFNFIEYKKLNIRFVHNYIPLCERIANKNIDITDKLNKFFSLVFTDSDKNKDKYDDDKDFEKLNKDKKLSVERYLEKAYFENQSGNEFLNQISKVDFDGNDTINWIKVSINFNLDKLDKEINKIYDKNVNLYEYSKIPYALFINNNISIPKYFINLNIEFLENISAIYSYNNKDALKNIYNYIENVDSNKDLYSLNFVLCLLRMSLRLQSRDFSKDENIEDKDIKDIINIDDDDKDVSEIKLDDKSDKEYDAESLLKKYDFDLIVNLCNKYIECENLYLNNLYNTKFISDEYISILPREHRFGYYFIKAMNMFNSKKYVDFIKELKIALKHNEYMKNLIKFFQDYISENYLNENTEEVLVNDEFNLLAIKVKEQANALINAGMISQAKDVLNQLLTLCPNDSEVIKMLKKIDS